MYRLLLAAILLFTISSCRKEKTTWDSSWSAPLVHGELTINDLIPPEYVETNSEDYLSLVFHESAYKFTIDTLVDLPDTAVVNKLTLGPGTITVGPSFTFNDTYGSDYNIPIVELKQAIVKEGTANIMVSSPWEGDTKLTLTFPRIYEDGSPLQRVYFLDSASIDNPFVLTDQIDMSNLDMDLTGISGLEVNQVPAHFLVESNESSESFTVEPTDSVTISVSFVDLVPKYARGYFGSHTFSDTLGFGLAPMKKVIGGTIDVDSIDLTLTVKNGFNLIAQSTISKLTGINTRTAGVVNLSFPNLGESININPASGGLWTMTPSEYPIPVNNINSNIAEFVENLSDSLAVGYELKINPFGNTSGGNDELFPESALDLFVDAEFPLDFGANQLTLVDTFDINYDPIETVIPDNGEIILDYTNAFPLGASAKFYLMDDSNAVLDSIVATSGITPGSYDAGTFLTSTAAGTVTYSVPNHAVEALENTTKIMLKVSFDSDGGGKVKIDANSFFKFLIRTNLQIQLQV